MVLHWQLQPDDRHVKGVVGKIQQIRVYVYTKLEVVILMNEGNGTIRKNVSHFPQMIHITSFTK